MNRLLNPENKLFTAIGILGDHLILSLLWLLCSLPVVTVGAASAAISKVSMAILEGKGYRLVRDFFCAFRDHFWKATAAWLIGLVIGILLVWDFYFYYGMAGKDSQWQGVLLGGFFVLFAAFIGYFGWIFFYISRYPSRLPQAAKGALYLCAANPVCTLIMVAARVVFLVAAVFAQFLLPFLPGLIALTDGLCFRRTVKKYEKKPAEDAATEDARPVS